MNKILFIGAAFAVAAASQAITFSNVAISAGGFTPAGVAYVNPIQGVAGSYSATVAGTVAPGGLGSSQWTFNFDAGAGHLVTGLKVVISGTTSTGGSEVDLVNLDVLNNGVAGTPSVFDLQNNGGGPDGYINAGLTFTDNFPTAGQDPSGKFNLVQGVQQGRVSLGNLFDTTGTFNVTVTPTVSPVPEPASMAVLGIGAIGLIARRRRNK